MKRGNISINALGTCPPTFPSDKIGCSNIKHLLTPKYLKMLFKEAGGSPAAFQHLEEAIRNADT